MLIATNSCGSLVGSICNCLFGLGNVLLCAHALQLLMVVYTLFALFGQRTPFIWSLTFAVRLGQIHSRKGGDASVSIDR